MGGKNNREIMVLSKFQNFALYLYFFSLNFEMLNLGGFGSTSRFVSIIYLLSISFDIKNFIKSRNIKRFYIPWVIFFLYLILISIINIGQYTELSHIIDTTLLFNILFFVFLINHERKEPDVLINGFISFVLGAILISFFYMVDIGVEYDYGRITMFGDNQNKIATRLAIAIILIFYFNSTKSIIKNRIKYLLLIPLPILLQLLFETASRVSFLSIVSAIFIGVLFSREYKLKRKFLVSSLLIVFIVFYGKALYLKSEILVERLADIEEKGLTSSRDMVWDNALDIIATNPIFGVGKSGYVEKSILFSGKVMSPHNVILEIWAYSGIIGLFLFFLFMYRILKISFKSFMKYKFILPILLLIPIAGQIITGQILGHKLYWAVFALCATTTFKYERIK